jgi:hypothetical protein
MRFEFDLSAAPVLRAVDDGVYLLKIIASKEKENDKGNTEISWEFHIEQPENLMVDDARVDTIYYRQYISKEEPKKSLGFLRELWVACGKLVPGQGYFDTQDLWGSIVGAEIVKQPGTPEFPNEKNQVKKWFPQSNMPPVGLKPKA